jgi:Tfp pilus assembly protein FimV
MTATLHTTYKFESPSAEPNYAMRRIVVGLIAAILVVIVAVPSVAAIGALTGFGGRPAAASEAAPVAPSDQRTFAIYVAEPGDSLWSIAAAYRGGVGVASYVDALIDLNGGTAIQAGQAIRLP